MEVQLVGYGISLKGALSRLKDFMKYLLNQK